MVIREIPAVIRSMIRESGPRTAPIRQWGSRIVFKRSGLRVSRFCGLRVYRPQPRGLAYRL